MKSEKYSQSAEKAIKNCLHAKDWKNFLIICDPSSRSLAELFYQVIEYESKQVILIQTSPDTVFNGKLANVFQDAFQKAHQAIFILPELAPQHLPPWLENQEKTRILCISASSRQTFSRWMRTDFNKITEKTQKLGDLFTIGRKLEIQSSDGTHLQVTINAVKGLPDTRSVHRNIHLCFLPPGEVRIPLPKNKIEGRAVIDFISGQFHEGEFAEITIKDGFVLQIKGKTEIAAKLRKFFRKHGPASRRILEISVGTNEHLAFGKSEVEDRKVSGGLTLTVGLDKLPQSHLLGMVILAPTLCIDGRRIVENGEFLVH